MKIEIADDILALVITSKDQLKPGMKLWQVGQGGVTHVCPPSYEGEVIGIGWSSYTDTEVKHGKCMTFKIEENDPEFVVLATDLDLGKLKDDPEPRSIIKPIDKLMEVGEYRRSDIRSPDYHDYDGDLYIVNQSFLPQSYNNWYMCDSLEKAQKVYEAMSAAWTPAHEKARAGYEERMSWDMEDWD